MIEFYPQIRGIHILAVVLSGSLFALRGAGVLANARWPRAAAVRYLSYSIDTVLLTAALMLLTFLPAAMFANHWLMVKVLLVVAYVVLGMSAMRRAGSRSASLVFYVAALLVFAAIVGIARAHHPLGWFLRSVA
jgi:uncharacterized membrane protein SirB2